MEDNFSRSVADLESTALHRKSSVGAVGKVSPNWSQENMTCHSSNCFKYFGDFSSEQLLHDRRKSLKSKSL